MSRMVSWVFLGGVIGFTMFGVCFFTAAPSGGPDRWLWVVFALMAAVPVAALGALFATYVGIREELEALRDDISRLRRIEDMIDNSPNPSTHVKKGPLEL